MHTVLKLQIASALIKFVIIPGTNSVKYPDTEQEEVAKVQESVEEFNAKIEGLIWSYRQEEFEQGLKFVRDKDGEWNKYASTPR